MLSNVHVRSLSVSVLLHADMYMQQRASTISIIQELLLLLHLCLVSHESCDNTAMCNMPQDYHAMFCYAM
jgi:hypothetical protein